MKQLSNLSKALVFTGMMLLVTGAQAAGCHADSHGHGTEDQNSAPTDIGRAGDPAQVSRTVAVDMTDVMRFTPEQIDVKAGETLRFLVTN
jgi:uncharacterized cupredoxin-like copper-binding protein